MRVTKLYTSHTASVLCEKPNIDRIISKN